LQKHGIENTFFPLYIDSWSGWQATQKILMEDGASQHTAKQHHESNGVHKMIWPANSPDLNPIENIWRLLKHNVDKRFPHTNSEVRRCAEEEWARLQSADFVKYIGNMRERCQAVINAPRRAHEMVDG
jgi:DDE superfamily endonuclease